jgi:4'-phosphopantetheinyl transferase
VIDVPSSPGADEPDEPDEVGESTGLSLWWAPLDLPAPALRRLTACLSTEERARAAGYHRRLDGDRFAAARGWLRRLLGSQSDCPPDEVRMITGEHGKPALVGADLRFNAARSGGKALYATSPTTEVGVDIEEIRATVDVDGMAATFFSPAERAVLASLPTAPRRAAAFRCWTRKEAYVKGTATGLTVPVDTLEVGVGGVAKVSDWAVHQVDVAPGFVAAVAAHRYAGTAPIVHEIVLRF